MVCGIKFMSVALGVRSVDYDVMTMKELERLLELLEREYVEKYWFKKYRFQADREWIEKQGF
jgi:hypothetical protein